MRLKVTYYGYITQFKAFFIAYAAEIFSIKRHSSLRSSERSTIVTDFKLQ